MARHGLGRIGSKMIPPVYRSAAPCGTGRKAIVSASNSGSFLPPVYKIVGAAIGMSAVTTPVYGMLEKSLGGAADLCAGPNKFGSYYSGVLPNGRIVKPAGTSIQVGM